MKNLFALFLMAGILLSLMWISGDKGPALQAMVNEAAMEAGYSGFDPGEITMELPGYIQFNGRVLVGNLLDILKSEYVDGGLVLVVDGTPVPVPQIPPEKSKPPKSSENEKDGGGKEMKMEGETSFIFPQGVSYSIFTYTKKDSEGKPVTYTMHTGCEDGSCVAGAILGKDFVVPQGTSLFAPFSGKIVRDGKDGLKNTILVIRSDDGKWQFGTLHQDNLTKKGDHVEAGQTIATAACHGKCKGPVHFHIWVRNIISGENVDPEVFLAEIQKPASIPTPESTQVPLPDNTIIIGKSVEGRGIVVYRFGNGTVHRLLIGGIHGGYEGNTVLLSEKLVQYFTENSGAVPPEVTLWILPDMNPDGYNSGSRFNANNVDLNRNWDYNWSPTARHGDHEVSGGSAPFSEPETAALKTFIEKLPAEKLAVVFYHSGLGGEVYCGIDTVAAPLGPDLQGVYANASGYAAKPGVSGITGDASDYLSARGIVALIVELTNHDVLEWDRNIAGILVMLGWNIK